MNLQITQFRATKSSSEIEVTNLIGEKTTFLTRDFLDWFTCWSNDQGHGTWYHDPMKLSMSHVSTAMDYDEERDEYYEAPFRCTVYTCSDFFLSYHLQLTDLFTRYTQSESNLVWAAQEMAA